MVVVALLTLLPAEAVVMLRVVAPVLSRVMAWELYEPVTFAVPAKRTLSEPLAVPSVCVKVAVEAYVVPSLETSNPVGAVAAMFPVKLLPAIVNVWTADGVPYVDVNAVALPDELPLIVMVGTRSTEPLKEKLFTLNVPALALAPQA